MLFIDDEFKLFDIQWYKRNIYFESFLFRNYDEQFETFDIIEDIIFSNDIIFTSNHDINLNYKNSSLLIIFKYYLLH